MFGTMETFIKIGSIKTLYTTPKKFKSLTLDKKSGTSCREKERERVGGRLRNLLKIFYTLEKFGLLTIFWLPHVRYIPVVHALDI